MTQWPVHAIWRGPIVLVGLGSIGRGSLPLLLRHIDCDPKKFTIVEPLDDWKHLADKYGVNFHQAALTKENYKKVMMPLLKDEHQALIINLTVDVDSVDMMLLARETECALCRHGHRAVGRLLLQHQSQHG